MDSLNINQNDRFDITDREIKKFLRSPENIIKYNLRFFEALFIKYLRDYDFNTLEGIDMLLSRQTIDRNRKNKILLNYEELGYTTFNKEIRTRVVNVSVISHMLIPILRVNGIYDLKDVDLKQIVYNPGSFTYIANKLKHIGAQSKQLFKENMDHAIDDYDMAGFMSFTDRRNPTIEMSEYQAINEIKRYRKAYGNHNVNSVDYYVKKNILK